VCRGPEDRIVDALQCDHCLSVAVIVTRRLRAGLGLAQSAFTIRSRLLLKRRVELPAAQNITEQVPIQSRNLERWAQLSVTVSLPSKRTAGRLPIAEVHSFNVKAWSTF
jgi:hypothetical protein